MHCPDQRAIRRLVPVAIVVVSAALLLAACGGSNVSTESGSTVPTTPSSPPPVGGSDTTNPSVNITAPTSASVFSTANATITVSGSATDNVGVTRVSWSNSSGGSGSQNFNSASVNWSFNVALQSGANVLTVTARDAAGNSQTDQITVTRTANTNIANLTWDANAESDVVGYRVYYGTNPGNYQQVRGAGIEVTSGTGYTVTGLNNGVRYYFAVTAFDGSGNESGYSREVFKDIP